MSYLELDDGILDHPKFIRAARRGGSDAIHLWLGLRAYCGQHLTDGHVPADMIDEVRGPKDPEKRAHALEVLKDCKLLDERPDGIEMHDFLDWSASKEEILERRRVSGMRSALRASPKLMQIVKTRDHNRCRYCGIDVDWTDRRGPIGGTYDHVHPLSKGGLNTVENIVVACRGCNRKKSERTPEEAGMDLIDAPDPPRSAPVVPTSSEPVTYQKTTGHHSTPLLSTPLRSPPDPDPPPKPPSPRAAQDGPGADPPEEEQQEAVLQQISPTDLESALKLPPLARARIAEARPGEAQWLVPQRWPEVETVFRAFGAAWGLELGSPGHYDRDAGTRAVVGALAAGFTVEQLQQVALKSAANPLFRKGNRSLGMLTPEVIRRTLGGEFGAPRTSKTGPVQPSHGLTGWESVDKK